MAGDICVMARLNDEEEARLQEILRLFYADCVVEAYQKLVVLGED